MCERPKLAIKNPTGGRPLFLTKSAYEVTQGEKLELPCGKCLECRLKHSAEWSTRCQLESRRFEHNKFLTLTFDDKHLPSCGVSKAELSSFMKSLRKHYERAGHTGIRFFGCGEYGKKYLRPHYHLILFNCPPFGDETLFFTNKLGMPVYRSATLEKLWNKGHSSIGSVTQQSAGYVARYALKKIHSGLPDGLNPEFINMSRGKDGGIATTYFNENWMQIYRFDEIIMPEGKVVRPPKFFDRKLKAKIRSDFGYKEVPRPNVTDEVRKDWDIKNNGYHFNTKKLKITWDTDYSALNEYEYTEEVRRQMEEIKREADEVFDNSVKLPRRMIAEALLKQAMEATGLTADEIRKQKAERLKERVKRLQRTWEDNRTENHYKS